MKITAVMACIIFAISVSEGDVRATPYYSFHNSFWINLHQSLFHEASLRAGSKDGLGVMPLPAEAFSKGERETWEKAVAYYRENFTGRNQVGDERLVKINQALTGDDSPDWKPSRLHAGLLKVLQDAAPVYRQHWWAKHQETNQHWIATMESKIKGLDAVVIPRLEKTFRDDWPVEPLRVDVTYFVGNVGHAFTTVDPGHTTIASSDDSNLDEEAIFHEGAHLLTYPLTLAIDRECQAQHKDCRDLWHAVQFYTVGEVLKEELAQRGAPDYVPYADKAGVYDRGQGWKEFRSAIQKDWQPYIEGKKNYDEAIEKLVGDI